MRKIIALVLILASLMLLVCACAEKEDNTPSANNPNNPTNPWIDNLPELDLEQADIKFVIGEADPPQTLSARSIHVDVDDGDIVNSAIYNRNQMIEDRFNCQISLVNAVQGGMQSAVTPSLMAGDDDYDILGARQHDDIDLCLDGYCLNLNTLSEYNADYIELDQPWWGTEYIDKMTYQDHLYWITGALSLRYISGANCLFVNTELYQKHVEETHGDIYEIVKEGNWTLDLMAEMASLSYSDSNGNDKSDSGDIFGLYLPIGADMPDAFAYAYGIHYSHENADGSLSFNLVDTNYDYLTFMSKMSDIYTSEYSFHSNGKVPEFIDGEVLFRVERIQSAELSYREMEQDFYIIPLPKKDTSSEYATTIHDGNLLFGISYCTPQIAEAAAVLEAMAAESYNNVMPAYYDTALKYKYTRDDNAAEMIDLIRDSITTDFCFIWGEYLGTLFFTRRNINANVTSSLKKNKSTFLGNFNKLIEEFEALEQK